MSSNNPPRKLSANPRSIYYNEEAVKAIDKVFLKGIHAPQCYAYDMDEGWVIMVKNGINQMKQYGEVTVTMKEDQQ